MKRLLFLAALTLGAMLIFGSVAGAQKASVAGAQKQQNQAGDEGHLDQQGHDQAHRHGEQRSVRLRSIAVGTELFAHLQDSGKDEQVPLRDTSLHEGKRHRQALAVDEGKRSF
jgi:hypothetical protein